MIKRTGEVRPSRCILTATKTALSACRASPESHHSTSQRQSVRPRVHQRAHFSRDKEGETHSPARLVDNNIMPRPTDELARPQSVRREVCEDVREQFERQGGDWGGSAGEGEV